MQEPPLVSARVAVIRTGGGDSDRRTGRALNSTPQRTTMCEQHVARYHRIGIARWSIQGVQVKTGLALVLRQSAPGLQPPFSICRARTYSLARQASAGFAARFSPRIGFPRCRCSAHPLLPLGSEELPAWAASLGGARRRRYRFRRRGLCAVLADGACRLNGRLGCRCRRNGCACHARDLRIGNWLFGHARRNGRLVVGQSVHRATITQQADCGKARAADRDEFRCLVQGAGRSLLVGLRLFPRCECLTCQRDQLRSVTDRGRRNLVAAEIANCPNCTF